MPNSNRLAIIGAGVMAEAIARGLLDSGAMRPEQIIAADVVAARRELFLQQLKIRAIENAAEAVAQADVVLLSVKPYQMQAVLGDLAKPSRASVDALWISIAAGISTATIEQAIGGDQSTRVVRAMPNTPMLVGQGMVALAAGKWATEEDIAIARRMFSPAARVIQVSEDKIDAVTAVSGSGPAYFFLLVEQMISAGVRLGLTPAEARELAIQTAVGAAAMMSRSDDSPEAHRRRVTTPNGTTHAAISHMESHGWPKITVEAVSAAAKRSAELGAAVGKPRTDGAAK